MEIEVSELAQLRLSPEMHEMILAPIDYCLDAERTPIVALRPRRTNSALRSRGIIDDSCRLTEYGKAVKRALERRARARKAMGVGLMPSRVTSAHPELFTDADVLRVAGSLTPGCLQWVLHDMPDPQWNGGTRAAVYWALVRRRLRSTTHGWTPLGMAVRAQMRRERGLRELP